MMAEASQTHYFSTDVSFDSRAGHPAKASSMVTLVNRLFHSAWGLNSAVTLAYTG